LTERIFPSDEPYRPPPQTNNIWYHNATTDQVIVFVHGVLSDSNGCWYQERKGHGPGAYWPDLLRKDTRFADYSIFLGGYYTDVDAGQYEISDCAEELFKALQRPDEHNGAAVLDHKLILFLCHSMGGIVVRYMLTARPWIFADKRIGLLLIASPSFGSPWANRLDLLLAYFHNKQGKQLKWGNWNLKDLDDRFQLILNEKAIAQLIGAEACENRFVLHGKWLPPADPVVPRDSAGRYFGRVRMLPNTDHFSCVKPYDHSHPAYEFLSDFCRDLPKKFPQPATRAGCEFHAPLAVMDQAEQAVPDRPVCRCHHWDLSIDEEGDALNEMTYGGIVLLPNTSATFPLPPAEIQTGHTSPFELVWDGRTSEGVSLEKVVTDQQRVRVNVNFAHRPTQGHEAYLCLRNYDWNAYSMNMEEYRQTPGGREDGLDFAEKNVPESWDTFTFMIQFPDQIFFAKMPFFEVYDYSSGTEQRNDELTGKLQDCFYFSRGLNQAVLALQRPPSPFSYRISWLLAESAVTVTSPLLPQQRLRQRIFAQRLLQLRRNIDRGQNNDFTTDLQSQTAINAVLAAVAEYIRETSGGKELDPRALELSLMVLDEEQPEVRVTGDKAFPVLRIVAGTHLQDKDYRSLALFVGDGNAGRAWKRRMARIYDGTEKDPKRHIYIAVSERLRHRFLISVPLIDPESAAMIYGILNIGTFSEPFAEILRPLGQPDEVERLASYAQAYVLQRLLEALKM
jgi:hypothetical protein